MTPDLRERLLVSAAQAWVYAAIVSLIFAPPCTCFDCIGGFGPRLP